jgi:hypothetical protein
VFPQPSRTASPAAIAAEHAERRGAALPTDGLLRFRDGRAVTSRRYDHLWYRIGQRLPRVAAQGAGWAEPATSAAPHPMDRPAGFRLTCAPPPR